MHETCFSVLQRQKVVLVDAVICRRFSCFHFLVVLLVLKKADWLQVQPRFSMIIQGPFRALQQISPPHNLHRTVPFPFCGGFQQLLSPSNIWGSGAECLAAFSMWEPGLGEEVLVLPALKPSLKVGSTSGPRESKSLSLASPWRTEVVVSLLCWVLRSCLHASVSLSCFEKYYKKVVLETHYKTSPASSSFTLGLPQCRAIFYLKSETSCHRVLHHLCHNLKLPGL